jgi:2-oxoglutarate ferredoxin oxidoreductase subunit beta
LKRPAPLSRSTSAKPLFGCRIVVDGDSKILADQGLTAANNHTGSTKSFDYVREHNEAVNRLDVIPPRAPITVAYQPGEVEIVEQHDGSKLALKKIAADYDAHDRRGAMMFLQSHAAKGQIVTGLLYVEADPEDLHHRLNTVKAPLNTLGEKELCPGSAALDAINAGLR